jgi:ribosomal silencing factor RsfS
MAFGKASEKEDQVSQQGRQGTSAIERLLHRIEERLEQWREEHHTRFQEAEADRERIWAEATEREKLLAEAVERGEAEEISKHDTDGGTQAVFIVHSGEAARKLQSLAAEGARLSSVFPGKQLHGRDTGLEGSWVVFEAEADSQEG